MSLSQQKLPSVAGMPSLSLSYGRRRNASPKHSCGGQASGPLPAMNSSHLPRAVATIDLLENAVLDAGSGSLDRSTGQRQQAGATCRLPWLLRVHHAASSCIGCNAVYGQYPGLLCIGGSLYAWKASSPASFTTTAMAPHKRQTYIVAGTAEFGVGDMQSLASFCRGESLFHCTVHMLMWCLVVRYGSRRYVCPVSGTKISCFKKAARRTATYVGKQAFFTHAISIFHTVP